MRHDTCNARMLLFSLIHTTLVAGVRRLRTHCMPLWIPQHECCPCPLLPPLAAHAQRCSRLRWMALHCCVLHAHGMGLQSLLPMRCLCPLPPPSVSHTTLRLLKLRCFAITGFNFICSLSSCLPPPSPSTSPPLRLMHNATIAGVGRPCGRVPEPEGLRTPAAPGAQLSTHQGRCGEGDRKLAGSWWEAGRRLAGSWQEAGSKLVGSWQQAGRRVCV